MNNTELKATARYFNQLNQTGNRFSRIEYANINKLTTSLQINKKYLDQVQEKVKLLSSIQFPNISKLNNQIMLTKQQVNRKMVMDLIVNVINGTPSFLNNFSKKLAEYEQVNLAPAGGPTSNKTDKEKYILDANYSKANYDVYNAQLNAKKAPFEVFKAPLDAVKAPLDLVKAPFDAIKAPLDLYNTIVKAKENRQAAKKKDPVTPPAASTTDTGNNAAGAGKTKIPKDFGRVKTIVEKPIVKCYPKVVVNCPCDHGGGRGSKKKGKSGKRNNGSSRNSNSTKQAQKSYSSKVQSNNTEGKKSGTGNKQQAINSNSNKATVTSPKPSTPSVKSGVKLGGGPHLGIAGGAGLFSMGGSGLGGTPTMGDMASRLTDKIAGSKSGMIKGLGKGLLSGGSKLFAPLAIATSIAKVARAKPEERSGALGSAIGGTAGAALGGALGSVIPVVGTTIGAMAGGAIGSYVGGKLGETQIAKDALGAVSKGITGTFDYLADKTKNIKEGFMSFFNSPSKQATPPPPVTPAVNAVRALPAASLAGVGRAHAALSPAQAAARKANASAGTLQQVQIDPTQMKTISGYLTDLKAQVTNSIAVNVPAGAVQLTVQENEIDYDALVIQIGQRVVNELRKSMQNRKPTAPATTSAKPIMA